MWTQPTDSKNPPACAHIKWKVMPKFGAAYIRSSRKHNTIVISHIQHMHMYIHIHSTVECFCANIHHKMGDISGAFSYTVVEHGCNALRMCESAGNEKLCHFKHHKTPEVFYTRHVRVQTNVPRSFAAAAVENLRPRIDVWLRVSCAVRGLRLQSTALPRIAIRFVRKCGSHGIRAGRIKITTDYSSICLRASSFVPISVWGWSAHQFVRMHETGAWLWYPCYIVQCPAGTRDTIHATWLLCISGATLWVWLGRDYRRNERKRW